MLLAGVFTKIEPPTFSMSAMFENATGTLKMCSSEPPSITASNCPCHFVGIGKFMSWMVSAPSYGDASTTVIDFAPKKSRRNPSI